MKAWRDAWEVLFLLGVALGTALSGHASQFILVDVDDVQGYGPYAYADGIRLEGLPPGNLELKLTDEGALFCQPAGGVALGPMVTTNRMTMLLGGRNYRFLIVSSDFKRGYAAGRQTRNLLTALVVSKTQADDPATALEMLRQAQASNRTARVPLEVQAALRELQDKVELEETMRAAGKVKYEGRWMTREEASKRYRRRVAEEQRKRGMVWVDGTWMTSAAAEKHRRTQAAAETGEKCPRCNGTGSIHYEYALTPRSLRGTKPLLNRRFEKAGPAPANSSRHTSTEPCPDCGGSGRR